MDFGVAIIGCGDRGTVHARTWKDRKDTRIISVYDPDKARCARLAAETDARICRSFEEAIKSTGVNIVSVCVPTTYHCEVTCCAAENGRHVFCEKPLALTLEQGRKMLDVIEKTDIVFMPCFQNRDRSTFIKQRQIFQSGILGNPVRFRFADIREVRPKIAMHSQSQNGGVVIDMACHMIDIMRFITGEEPKRIYATGEVFGGKKQRLSEVKDLAIDEANIDVSFSKGHQLQMYLNWGMPEGFPSTSGQLLIGPNGMVRESAGSFEVVYSDHTETWPLKNPGTETRIARFADAVTGAAEPDITATDAFIALQVSHAALRSIRDGAPVELGLKI